MISYLKGTVAGIVKSSSRITLILEVNSFGYELQIPARLAQQLSAPSEIVQIFTHLQVREEQPFLYGFGSASERDLFRQLLSVSGIGGAIAIALLDTLEVPDLVQAIVSGNTQLLIQTPGVGGKTAERISLELKTKLADWRIASGLTVGGGSGPPPAIVEEVQLTLLALGYTPNEVAQALSAVSQQALLAKNANAEDWIRQAIAHLSNT